MLPAAIEAVRARGGLVIAQVNPRMPYTFGDGVAGHWTRSITRSRWTSRCRLRCTGSVTRHLPRPIGEHVAALVPEQATLQMGIGLGAGCGAWRAGRSGPACRSGRRCSATGYSALEKAGALDADQPITASFAFGSDELYDWLDHNPRVRMLRTEKTNDPGLIARQPNMTSINGALQVDLFAQANAARVRGLIHSGFGGQTDFVVGALHSPGGRAIIALPSWHPKAQVSTVVPRLAGQSPRSSTASS